MPLVGVVQTGASSADVYVRGSGFARNRAGKRVIWNSGTYNGGAGGAYGGGAGAGLFGNPSVGGIGGAGLIVLTWTPAGGWNPIYQQKSAIQIWDH